MVNRAIIAILLSSAALFAFPGEASAQCTGQPPGNRVCASPNGAAGLPGFRPLVAADMPAGAFGSVTSVSAGDLSPLFNSSVATPTLTPAITFAPINQGANLFYAGPSTGAAAAPTFRATVSADIPPINLATSGNGGVTGSLPVAQVSGLGTAATVNTGTSGATIPLNNGNNNLSGSNTLSGPVNFTSTFQVAGFSMTWPGNNATLPQLVARGTVALGTSSIGSAACAGAIAGTASAGNVANVLTTDTIATSFSADPTGVLGYQPLTTGMLSIIPYPTAGAVNFKVCNTTNAAITPGAITLNWRVTR